MSQGYIYILDNPALHPELLKIGKTTKSVEMRARGLSTTGLPDDFRVLHSIHVPDCHLAEALIHKKLAGHRVKANREFFRVPIALAKEALDQIATIAMRDDGREALAKNLESWSRSTMTKGLAVASASSVSCNAVQIT